jgi:LysR family hydrogen peroxide-inducible transcriptional activator
MKRPTLRQLDYLVAVAHHGAFGTAAEAVEVSQPALSAQIAELEARLGVVLFERGRAGARLTSDGAAVLAAAHDVHAAVRRLLEVADQRSDDLVGALRVGVIPTMAPYLLPTFVRELRRRYPDAEPMLAEVRTPELVDRLESGDLDVGLLAVPAPELGPRLAIAELARDPFVLALPDGHPYAGRSRLPHGALASLPMMLLEEGHCLRAQAEEACSAVGASPLGSVQATSLPAACQMVSAGMGATLLPASAIEVEARAGSGLTVRRLRRPEPFRTVALAWRAGAGWTTAFEQFAEALREPVAAACSLDDRS